VVRVNDLFPDAPCNLCTKPAQLNIVPLRLILPAARPGKRCATRASARSRGTRSRCTRFAAAGADGVLLTLGVWTGGVDATDAHCAECGVQPDAQRGPGAPGLRRVPDGYASVGLVWARTLVRLLRHRRYAPRQFLRKR
jgi:hypothetical protein